MKRVLVAAAAVAFLAAGAAASIVVRATPRELADSAGLVVEGRVAAVDVRWDDGRTCINTYVTFTVERTHKGTPAGSVVVKVPGGKVGEEEVRVEGTAKFAKDEEAMLFLWKDRHGEWIVLGEAQGKFLLRQDEKAGKRMAENSLKGLCLVMKGDPKDEATKAAKRPDRLSYDDLCAVVKASVDAAAKKATVPGGTTVPATDTTGGNAAAPAPAPTTTPAPAPAPATGTSPTEAPKGTTPAGQEPAPPGATPVPPSTSTSGTSSGGAPPPSKDAPAPQAGSSVPPGGGQQEPPSPEKK
jgi:hypothetical protein